MTPEDSTWVFVVIHLDGLRSGRGAKALDVLLTMPVADVLATGNDPALELSTLRLRFQQHMLTEISEGAQQLLHRRAHVRRWR